MTPKIIHQTSRHLTPEEVRLRARTCKMLAGWEYRFWTDDDNLKMVEEHFPQYLERFQAIGRGVVKADIARYMYLSRFGGWYFDTDYKILRPIDESVLQHPCVLPVSRSSGGVFRLGNAVMGSEPGHPFWRDFLAHIFAHPDLANLLEARVEKITGPEGLTDFFLAHRSEYPDIYLPERGLFHPQLTMGGFSWEKSPETLGVHLCWGSWRTKGPLGLVRALAARKITSLW